MYNNIIIRTYIVTQPHNIYRQYTVQLEGNLTKTCGWQAKEMRVNLVRVPQICAGARKGKYPDIRHLVIKMSYYSPICS